jgi:hypothetical protein
MGFEVVAKQMGWSRASLCMNRLLNTDIEADAVAEVGNSPETWIAFRADGTRSATVRLPMDLLPDHIAGAVERLNGITSEC